MGESLRYIWKYAVKYKSSYLIGLILVIFVTILSMVNPYMIGIITREVIYGGNTEKLFTYVAIMGGSTLLICLLRYIYLMKFETISQQVVFEIREDLYEKLQILDFRFYDSNKTGEI